jgi:hypothetical protein
MLYSNICLIFGMGDIILDSGYFMEPNPFTLNFNPAFASIILNLLH